MSMTFNDVGAVLQPKPCGAASAVAAGTGDATAVTGATIDRSNFGSAVVQLVYLTSLTAAKTLSLAVEYQTSPDDSTWATAVPLLASTVVKTGAASAFVGQTVGKVDLTKIGGGKYIRFNFTPDLSHTSTDTFVGALGAVMGGKVADLPTSQTYDFSV